ncbi:uncharacterized protein LOC123317442 [Coccinella septempunctata]|uniref:uncharacterized protein LOC123317442 n=1 Tax=Coccinella septempunctata TaxID=41139 RepID=UPI001D061639|nr:uncharacterized protein LOC123317442 [Coccinella septempunctata]
MAESVEESDDARGQYDFKSSYILVAIDTHSSMFTSEGQPTPFKNCINALYRLSDVLLLKSDKRGWCPFCVILYDREEKATLVDFKDNMIKATKFLKEKSKLSEEQLKNEYMRKEDLDLAEYFQLCKKKLRNISTTAYKRILIFITNDPDPVCGDASKRFTALQEAKNFEGNDITFQLVVNDENFQYKIFYNELFSLLDKPSQEIICEDEEGLFEKLVTTICFRLSQRKLCFYPFADDSTKYITIIRKSYIKQDRLLNNSFVAEDGTPLKRITRTTSDQENVTEIKRVFHNLNTKKNFEELEFDVHENMGEHDRCFPVGLTLLYVCHRLSGIGEVISEPRILEADASEKLPFFDQFWQYCVRENKVLVCARVLRRGQYPEAVELIPKLIHGNKVYLEKLIAYADEIFEPEKRKEEDVAVTITEEQKRVTDSLIQQLTFEFQSSFLIDEAHLRKVEYVKSKLLDEERRDIQAKDLLTPEEIDEKLGPIVDEFLRCFPPERGVKRKK